MYSLFDQETLNFHSFHCKVVDDAKPKFLPAHERVFHIFISRINMANKCARSPANRNTFILCLNYCNYQLNPQKLGPTIDL